jgi:hypothetical protein
MSVRDLARNQSHCRAICWTLGSVETATCLEYVLPLVLPILDRRHRRPGAHHNNHGYRVMNQTGTLREWDTWTIILILCSGWKTARRYKDGKRIFFKGPKRRQRSAPATECNSIMIRDTHNKHVDSKQSTRSPTCTIHAICCINVLFRPPLRFISSRVLLGMELP